MPNLLGTFDGSLGLTSVLVVHANGAEAVRMGKKKKKPTYCRIILRLPDLDQAKSLYSTVLVAHVPDETPGRICAALAFRIKGTVVSGLFGSVADLERSNAIAGVKQYCCDEKK